MEQFIRVFMCDGVEIYAIVGIFVFAGTYWIVARLAHWDNSYIYRMWFVLFTAVGVLAGGGVYLLFNGSC